MEGDFIKTNDWLLPLSWLYGIGVRFRNALFEMGILKSRSFAIPIISVGNITVGGSGKTPHVEYLIRLLQDSLNVAVLSRGYKRKTKGYLVAQKDTTMEEIGDEPYQMMKKFPKVTVAVDKNRCHGIDRLTSDEATKETDVILLDDAYQHRYVTPGVNILLVDYHRIIIYDKLLPAGRLREPKEGARRADVVLVTKCPKNLKPMEFRVLQRAMQLYPYQKLFFTCLDYGKLKGVFTDKSRNLQDIPEDEQTLLLTGIASPEQMLKDLEPYCKNLIHMRFRDHHDFNENDVMNINTMFAALPNPKCIITTEKDASRLISTKGLSDEVKQNIFALPIEVNVMLDKKEEFDSLIVNYVKKNSRNSTLNKNKHKDHKKS